jgi:C1A family cysteine protease
LLLSSELSNQSAKALSVNSGSVALKLDIDWSVYTGSIKYQGLCGACYAFSSADTFAAVNAINKYSFYVPLSVQQIIDCVDNGLTFGCSGGYLEGAFTYIQMNGINIEQTYPYASMNSGKAGKCKQEGGPFKLSSFNSIQEGDCNGVLKSLALGPVSAGIAGYKLQFYDTGIFNDCNTVLDHAVVIVGYRSGVGWRIKNSWGTEWG